ncbi:23S rRNA (pseudouridine(1915)-N(3))-methyltransferase RlmH [Mycoplasmopsis phocirhinis]|uniref:Ribosomal RNA large subunit methyltransferase H n=1 Tax=Mycoplasmopsis phocirhinis TaxID=142650 RepID=A0A4P6MMG2_9BACT|nr:23S rRNA (pseudouridine(1915)-N(3))-methyltransferase RlmH [Mycoplasmopsis phocirhinis]QBF34825.1 23S rRNA (pseudouridine(1915)-N(3))-methyltransferase RlmH [Mycoplasmopsis phocirhinis]
MKKIKIIAVGSLNPEFKKLFSHYEKSIARYYSLTVTEIKEFSEEKNIETKKFKETQLIIKSIPNNSYVVLCSLKGKSYNSIKFSNLINTYTDLTFIIGGSDGMCEAKILSNEQIIFSHMTFPHQLFRIMLGEQIYRAATILNNKKYHK